MLGFHRQRGSVHRGHCILVVPGGQENWKQRNYGAYDTEDHEVLLGSCWNYRFPRVVDGRALPLVKVKLHLRQ